ncbi:Serine/threonine-protein kinase [Lachnellula willkommii]|uniref:non-specific serine/threonine protein kinase n=1 Tax=Lachnellula willkommii TaxID=215461 RepID=A0A559M201_9HELO|nr:Serine/threonine-protein kinase [Lachnellula willkommii]
MALANEFRRGDDDANDHIDSDTPRSGVATPQPDPSDKRLPGIMQYFGQVGLGSSKNHNSKPKPRSNSNINSNAGSHSGPLASPSLAVRSNPENPLPSCAPESMSGDAAHLSVGPDSINETAGECNTEEVPQLSQEERAEPPQAIPTTPTRALSNQTAKSDTSGGSEPAAAAANANENANANGNGQNGKANIGEALPIQTSAGVSGAPVAAPKGKLTVKITEARGLRRSRDPYVVAVFQRNELVSKGPLHEDRDENEEVTSKPMMGGIPIMRSGSDSGRPMAIPMKSRQSSNTSLSEYRDFKSKGRRSFTNPKWDTEAVFDVVGSDSRVNITIYDQSSAAEEFLGHVDLAANLTENDNSPISGWFPLQGKNGMDTGPSGEIFVEINFQRTEKRHYGPEDFQILKLIGKGTFGQVYQVRKKDTKRIYAMKVLQKKVIVQKKEVAHTVGERNILVRTAMADSPFIVGLKFSFQTPSDLYLVTDFMSGGELFWHLQKEGRFDEKRAKFYIAELILALQHLHMHDIVYRDLKPENILLDANGHIALCDFGLSKANLTKNATTNTFCGTTEYLAPEVLLDEAGYTKMVDFWSLGVLVFEMCCGWSPFYAEDTQQMYKNIAFGKVRFPRDTLTTEGRNFVKGLLNRNPKHRLGAQDDAEELKRHPFFSDIDWDELTKKLLTPPFKPKLKSETDTSNFDPEFTNALNGASSLNARAAALAAGVDTSTPLSPGMQANFKGFTFVDESSLPERIQEHMQNRGVKEDYDMDEEEKREHDWEEPFERRSDRMSGIVKTNNGEDSSMFNGGHFDM